ncbi:glutamine synthetase family protein [Acidianus manzaensis]|uniref:Glutamate--ammonia ligase n=1 Tax=Acidianus manzaensis TaxID=282676 RepID=A0A1W6JYR6_9CREN|nr:glutamine synthetase family protein [Acidianus manzaensis]ARM75382.1 glutamate--ammonia ligase [Acidianus manzaensis]
MEYEDVLKKLKSSGIDTLKIDFVDYGGFIRSKEEDIDELEDILENGTNTAKAIMNYTPSGTLARIGSLGVNSDDFTLVPDIDTLSLIPPFAITIGKMYDKTGKPWEYDLRWQLSNLLSKIKREFNIDFISAFEYEFYVTKENKPINDVSCYEIGGYYGSLIDKFLIELKNTLKSIGIGVMKTLKECGPSQYEFNIKHSDPIKTSDSLVFFKDVSKMIGAKYNYEINFMPKPFKEYPGSGLHLNLSAWSKGNNVFYDEKDDLKISETGYSFIAGILEHAKALTAIAAPTVNSYKRLVRIPDMWAPVKIGYGPNNRSTILRIPTPRFSSISRDLRLEYRVPDAASNPYLLFIAFISAGLDGIERGLKSPKPVNDNAYENKELEEIPRDLNEALNELKKDTVLINLIGDKIINEFIAVKKQELEEYNTIVTNWEFNIYKNL